MSNISQLGYHPVWDIFLYKMGDFGVSQLGENSLNEKLFYFDVFFQVGSDFFVSQLGALLVLCTKDS